MSSSAELVEYLARRLVDEPDEVRVEELERDGDLVIELYVAKDDVGKVIGRQGRIARALRTVVRRPRVAAAGRCSRSWSVACDAASGGAGFARSSV